MKKFSLLGKYLLFILILGFFSFSFFAIISTSNSEPNSCTIFTVTSGDNVYFCNNEDYYTTQMRMWFFPASEGKHGKVLYGFTYQHGFNPLGGMNDQGLSADENAIPYTPLIKDPNKPNYTRNNVFTRILEECATVNEVLAWIKGYNLVQLEMYPCQIHFADKTGDAAVIGIGSDGHIKITRKTGDYLISTNFNLAQGKKQCWRYETAEKMLSMPHASTIDYYKSVLKATSQGYQYPWYTKYSNINDLKNGILYFFSPHNYEYYAIINLNEELLKGFHSYDIITLVSREGGLPPNMPLILLTFLVLGSIMIGCIAIWIFKIRPKIITAKKIQKPNSKITT